MSETLRPNLMKTSEWGRVNKVSTLFWLCQCGRIGNDVRLTELAFEVSKDPVKSLGLLNGAQNTLLQRVSNQNYSIIRMCWRESIHFAWRPSIAYSERLRP